MWCGAELDMTPWPIMPRILPPHLLLKKTKENGESKGQVLHGSECCMHAVKLNTWSKAIDAFSASVTHLQSFASLRKELEWGRSKTLARALGWLRFITVLKINSVCINVPSSPRNHDQIHTHMLACCVCIAGPRLPSLWLASGVLSSRKAPARLANACHISLPRNGCHCSDGILAVASIACRYCARHAQPL